jgi:hypothetical protein
MDSRQPADNAFTHQTKALVRNRIMGLASPLSPD